MLIVHVISSLVALAIGALLLVADKRWRFHGRLGGVYHWTMLLVAVSALSMSAARGRAVIFTYVTPPSYAFALLGYVSGRVRWSGWLRWHITGQSGSYIALLTGLSFQIIPRLLPPGFYDAHRTLIVWTLLLAPALLAQPLIVRTQRRWTRIRVARGFSPAIAA
jgi:hypothetical protein